MSLFLVGVTPVGAGRVSLDQKQKNKHVAPQRIKTLLHQRPDLHEHFSSLVKNKIHLERTASKLKENYDESLRWQAKSDNKLIASKYMIMLGAALLADFSNSVPLLPAGLGLVSLSVFASHVYSESKDIADTVARKKEFETVLVLSNEANELLDKAYWEHASSDM